MKNKTPKPLPIYSKTFFLFAFVLILFGCATHSTRTANFGTADENIGFGVYSAKEQDSAGMATKLSLNSNNSFSRKKFQGPCLLIESKGEWKSDHESIGFVLSEIKKRSDCNSENWSVEKSDKSFSRLLRNLTPTSFELLDQEDEGAEHWVHYLKR